MGQNALRLFAEYSIGSDVAMSTDHISSKANIIADTISRVNETFVPKKSHIYDVPFSILVKQVCSKYTEMKSWRIFLPSQELLSDLNSVLSSKYSTVALKRNQNCGRFVTAESIFCGTASNETFSTEYFL